MDNIRGSDLVMKSCLNGRERGVDEWKEFKNSDERFKFKGVKRVPGSRFSVKAIWEEDSAPMIICEGLFLQILKY